MSNEILVGWVTFFNYDKDFGFAEVDLPNGGDRIKVFLHRSNARVVKVDNYPGYTITSQADAKVSPMFRGRYPTRVVMQITRGDKGWRAIRWGTRPGPSWVYDMLDARSERQENTLAWFLGGEFTETTDGNVSAKGTMTEVHLLPLHLTVRLDDGTSYDYDLTYARSSFEGPDVKIMVLGQSGPDAFLRFHK